MKSQNREIINPDKVFQAEGFTHAVIPKGDKTVYHSGQLAWDENFQVIGDGDLLNKQLKYMKIFNIF